MDEHIAIGSFSARAGVTSSETEAVSSRWTSALTMLEAERRRVGRELHDETGQILTAALFQVDLCLADLAAGDASLAGRLRDLRGSLVVASRDLRRLAHSLCPPMLDELGLLPTLSWTVRQFQEQHQIDATLRAPETAELPRAVDVALFRIVQESLTNVAKHAGARSVRVELCVGADTVTCRIADDGRGFDVGASAVLSLGVVGMCERARQLGGDVTIISARGRGTSVQAVIPLGGGRG
jgi:signal transduction histidine kinase